MKHIFIFKIVNISIDKIRKISTLLLIPYTYLKNNYYINNNKSNNILKVIIFAVICIFKIRITYKLDDTHLKIVSQFIFIFCKLFFEVIPFLYLRKEEFH